MRNLSVIMLFVYVMLLAMPSFAESTCMTWLVTDDDKFRVAYALEVGETIAPSSLLNEAGTHYLACSSRVTDTQVDTLKSDRSITSKSDDISKTEGWPVGWVTKTEP